jgi:hypothetical protein
MARDYKLQRTKPVSASGIDYAAALNEEQFRAVTSPPGKALVIAGAGSGKTRTLTYRVSWLLDQGQSARDILLLTFTNKAAREMVERVRSLVPGDVSDLWAGTFHSICNRILRRHADEIGFTKSFSILDRDDQKSLMKAVVEMCDIDTKQRRFPKPDVLISMFSLMANTNITLEKRLHEKYPYFSEWQDELGGHDVLLDGQGVEDGDAERGHGGVAGQLGEENHEGHHGGGDKKCRPAAGAQGEQAGEEIAGPGAAEHAAEREAAAEEQQHTPIGARVDVPPFDDAEEE